MGRIETGIDGEQTPHTVEEQSCTDKQDKSEGNIGDNQRTARHRISTDSTPRTPLLQCLARDVERRDEAGGHTDHACDGEREEECSGINRDGIQAWQICRAMRNDRADAGQRHRDSKCSSQER